tara:strand:- start:725 stop:1030 length:306 start_codon:yes stop_codon:yes gene_type:complete
MNNIKKRMVFLGDLENNFGGWVIRRIHDCNMSMSSLTKMVGISRTSISRYKHGQDPHISKFFMICDVISTQSGKSLDDVILDASKTFPEYSMAKEREAKRK